MRSGILTAGRSRKCSLASRIRERIKRFLSVAVSVSVIACSMPAIPVMAATDDDDVQEFTMTANDLCDAVETALQADEPISESAYVFEGEARETYEDLFYGADVYEIEPGFKKKGSDDLSLKIFVRLGNDRELDSEEITGDEEIIFLLLNKSDEEATARIMIDEYETGLITVAPKSDVVMEETEPEETGISTLSVSADDIAEDESEETADEEAEEADDEDESEAVDEEADAETAADEESAEEEKSDDPEPDAPEDKDPKDSESEKPDDHKADDKGRDHEAGKGSDAGNKDEEKPGSDNKADKNDPKDKGDRDFTGGSHNKGDKADNNDSAYSSDKAVGEGSADSGEKADSEDYSSAEASKSSRRSNPLHAALDAEDDSDNADDAETEVRERPGRRGGRGTEAKAEKDKAEDITEDKDDDKDDIVIDIEEDEEEIITDIDEVEDQITVEVYAANAEADNENIIDEAEEAETISTINIREAKSGYTLIAGEVYEPVVVNHSRSGIAYLTTLQQLGIDYGIMPLASASNADTFKQAIIDSNDGDTVELTSSIAVDCSAGTYVDVATSNLIIDLGGNTITVSGTDKNYYLFNITSGGSVTIQNGTIDGQDSSSDTGSAVTPVYSGAADNDVTLDNITIQNFGSLSNGAVYASAGDLTVKDCTIQNNGGSGICANGCDNLVITGSTISENTATNGGGIFIINHKGDISITGNTISDNKASKAGGGIYIFLGNDAAESDEFAITKNTIKDNTADWDGGGIYFETPLHITGNADDFDLSGNTITGNKADTGYGGGMELLVDVIGREIVIKSGYIAENTAYWGAGIDSSYSQYQSPLHLYNTIITENEAGLRGGGIWACPSSETTMNVTFGAAIYNNSATGTTKVTGENWQYGPSGDEIRFEGYDTDAASIGEDSGSAYVSKRALGGTLMDWYADDDSRGKRYELGDDPVDVTTNQYRGHVASFGLHGELSNDGIEAADSDALLYITSNNSHTVGGGIAINTPIIFGSDEDETALTVTANKLWVDASGNELTSEQTEDYSVEITLVQKDEDRNTEKELETVTLSSASNWTWDFEELPTAYMDEDYKEHSYTYTVKEGKVVSDSAFEVEVKSSDVTKDEESGNSKQTVTITNTKAEGLEMGKQVNGSGNIPDEFSFKITLTYPDGTPYEGDVDVSYYTKDSDGGITDEHSDKLTFTGGEAEVTLAANGYINIPIGIGMLWEAEELTVNESETVYCETYVSLNGKETKAKAASGTIANSSQVIFINNYRGYYDIDEEIIPDLDNDNNRDSWEKNESVTEYGALEFEMSTFLPVISLQDIENEDSDFTMYFHNKLDDGLKLDASEADDLHITIGGKTIKNTDKAVYYTIDISETADRWDPSVIAPYALVDGNDECTFHVTVNLSKLYEDGVITIDDLTEDPTTGETAEIIIYFYVDLEGKSMDGSYKSTVQYQVFDQDELLYTSSESVVYVYTYEIGINKTSTSTGNGLAGATFGVYYDEACTQPVMRYGENYTVISDENGEVLFYGLAAGTYYLKELEAPEGYVLTTEIFKVVVGEEQVNISGSAGMSDDKLDGAVFEVYYDEDCTEPVRVDGVHYKVTSNSDGTVTFDGIAAGTYYLKGVEDSEGNDISSIVIPVTLDYDTFTYGYEFTVGNDPSGSTGSSGGGRHSSGGGGGGGGSTGGSGSVVGGPATGDAGESGNYYPSGTMPQTGDPGATGSLLMMLFGFGALLLMAIVDRKKKEISD